MDDFTYAAIAGIEREEHLLSMGDLRTTIKACEDAWVVGNPGKVAFHVLRYFAIHGFGNHALFQMRMKSHPLYPDIERLSGSGFGITMIPGTITICYGDELRVTNHMVRAAEEW